MSQFYDDAYEAMVRSREIVVERYSSASEGWDDYYVPVQEVPKKCRYCNRVLVLDRNYQCVNCGATRQ